MVSHGHQAPETQESSAWDAGGKDFSEETEYGVAWGPQRA